MVSATILVLLLSLSLCSASWYGKKFDLKRPEGQRSYWTFEPKNFDATEKLPLIVWLHPLTGDIIYGSMFIESEFFRTSSECAFVWDSSGCF
jgi:hypothetical protein